MILELSLTHRGGDQVFGEGEVHIGTIDVPHRQIHVEVVSIMLVGLLEGPIQVLLQSHHVQQTLYRGVAYDGSTQLGEGAG